MTSEIHQAFAHPEARSAASAGDAPLDRISVRDHVVAVEIGAFQAERGKTQRVSFNIVVEVQPLSADLNDDVDRILSYDRVTEAIAHELAAERLNLLETLAERIADRILYEPQAVRVFIRIEKLDRGPYALGVEIVRTERDAARRRAEDQLDVPHPRVVYLSNAAMASENLPKWLDGLQAQDAPVILCVGGPDVAPPKAGHPMAQRRIDLLAIEQNAWVLAARDPRCVVVATRTELDWAMKHGQISVWAPSKVVLDSVEGPSNLPRESVALAAWVGQELAARELVIVGAEPPKDGQISARSVPLDSATI
ncbi:dihydroneopterin aldolase [Pseudoprimorskyibacter insulae]|uniref:dihydroneopterin aldolase n=1 Tax=Pseudoprimorskyibacter insulae TaxID=1695997 RepID=A0A2R8ARG9_9RHOB|nr:dihydroneopterin aldolase [Pseudoprimorskyibacter insulae]SPF78454.1 hypothetical protein PRI8871_01057 [Pseudoprimorskyibacter insulae]